MTDGNTLRMPVHCFHERELSPSAKEAIAVHSGHHPDGDEAEPDPEQSGPQGYGPMIFLENVMPYASRSAFDSLDLQAFATLDTFAKVLRDAMALMTNSNEAILPELIIASLAANMTVDARSREESKADFLADWLDLNELAQALYSRCLRPSGKGRRHPATSARGAADLPSQGWGMFSATSGH